MTRRTLITWAVLILVPVLPVIVFYLIFGEQNYFELENAARGIVATGPIAAYIVLVVVGARINKQISAQIHPLSEAEEALVGSAWEFAARSKNGSDRTGSFEITADERETRLCMSGSFKLADGTDVGNWKSTMAECEAGLLQIVYALEDSGKGATRNSTGMLSLRRNPTDPDKMSGTWVVLGDSTSQGTMTSTKIRR